jgi:hypothetical protein
MNWPVLPSFVRYLTGRIHATALMGGLDSALDNIEITVTRVSLFMAMLLTTLNRGEEALDVVDSWLLPVD